MPISPIPRSGSAAQGLSDDKCKVNLDATIIDTAGKTKIEKYTPASDAKVDCFFVYPTVSDDKTWASDWTVDKMEIDDIKLQFARFGSVCRQFAPIYRQTTLTTLRIASGGPQPIGERLPQGVGGYNDVVDAWNWYMANENNGRGVMLIGHSQGAGVLSRLIANEIEGKPAQKQFISAMILGSAVMVPPGKLTGGSFKAIPLCTAEDQTGCVITYASFRDTLPPPATSRFGKAANRRRRRLHQPVKPRRREGDAGVLLPHQGIPERIRRHGAARLGQTRTHRHDPFRENPRPRVDPVQDCRRIHLP